MSAGPDSGTPRRRWPAFVLAAVVLFLLLNAYWLSREVHRIRRYRESSTPQTNAVPASPGERK